MHIPEQHLLEHSLQAHSTSHAIRNSTSIIQRCMASALCVPCARCQQLTQWHLTHLPTRPIHLWISTFNRPFFRVETRNVMKWSQTNTKTHPLATNICSPWISWNQRFCTFQNSYKRKTWEWTLTNNNNNNISDQHSRDPTFCWTKGTCRVDGWIRENLAFWQFLF